MQAILMWCTTAFVALVLGVTWPSGAWQVTAAGTTMTAQDVLAAVNAKYAAIRAQKRRVYFTSLAILRSASASDRVIRSLGVAHQDANHILYHAELEVVSAITLSHLQRVEATGTLNWLLHGTRMEGEYRQPTPDGDFIVKQFKWDQAHLPTSFGTHYHNPLSADELPQEFMQHAFVLREEIFRGQRTLTLRSSSPIALSPVNEMEVKLWVDPETWLVGRMESHAIRHDPETKAVQTVSISTDLTYELGANFDAQLFAIRFAGPEAENWTGSLIQGIAEKLGINPVVPQRD
jgi:hypothetical protein